MKKENLVMLLSVLAVLVMFIFSMWALSLKPEKEDNEPVELISSTLAEKGVVFQLKNFNSEKTITVLVEVIGWNNRCVNKTLTLQPNEVIVDNVIIDVYGGLYSIRIISAQ